MTPTSPSLRRPFEIRGWHVLAGVSAFFAVVIAVNVVFMVLAYRTFPGQVSVTPYEDGLVFNRRIADLEAQDRLGWRAAVSTSPREIALTVVDRDGAPLSGLTVTGGLRRPATEAGAVMLAFRETAPGRYLAPVSGLAGAWDFSARAEGPAGGRLTAERRLTWP
ncbi:MAG: FixH family protein [Phenylobacterium sp.]|jgi:nitrogen fixation protein FixH